MNDRLSHVIVQTLYSHNGVTDVEKLDKTLNNSYTNWIE